VPAILGNENVSVYSSSEDDSSMFTEKKITSRNKITIKIKGQLEGVLKEEMQQTRTDNHDALLLLPHWLT
jgi:hypothetical protein